MFKYLFSVHVFLFFIFVFCQALCFLNPEKKHVTRTGRCGGFLNLKMCAEHFQSDCTNEKETDVNWE